MQFLREKHVPLCVDYLEEMYRSAHRIIFQTLT